MTNIERNRKLFRLVEQPDGLFKAVEMSAQEVADQDTISYAMIHRNSGKIVATIESVGATPAMDYFKAEYGDYHELGLSMWVLVDPR